MTWRTLSILKCNCCSSSLTSNLLSFFQSAYLKLLSNLNSKKTKLKQMIGRWACRYSIKIISSKKKLACRSWQIMFTRAMVPWKWIFILAKQMCSLPCLKCCWPHDHFFYKSTDIFSCLRLWKLWFTLVLQKIYWWMVGRTWEQIDWFLCSATFGNIYKHWGWVTYLPSSY